MVISSMSRMGKEVSYAHRKRGLSYGAWYLGWVAE